ncbi:hypothetical protein DQ806_10990 [Salmonella enterica subsp. enterica serovar Okatie]|nr:hypothetical protein [Salmonella enterica subsp. enterica serovar Okatie]
MTNKTSNFNKEQLIKRIEKQIDINATIIERLSDDSSAVSVLAVETATMDMKILDIALSALTASERPPENWLGSLPCINFRGD